MSKKNTSKNSVPSPLTPSAEDLYYEAMEIIEMGGDDIVPALEMLDQAYVLEPKSVQVQVGFVHVYGLVEQLASVHAHIEQAYRLTCEHFKKWPAELPWGVLENRPYLRALHYKADLLADEGDIEEAKKLYKLILKLNPSDNQGVRYLLAALYAGKSGEDVNELTDEGNMKQDWSALEKLLETQNKKHKFWKEPDEDYHN